MTRRFSSPEHEKVATQLRWSGRPESARRRRTGTQTPSSCDLPASSATGGLASPRAIDHIPRRRTKDSYLQTPSIWLQGSAGLAAWLWLAPIAASSSPWITPPPRGLPCLAPRSPGSGM